jgi:hypothetical protein
MFGMLWIDVHDSAFQFPQLLKTIEDEWDNIPQASNNSMINYAREMWAPEWRSGLSYCISVQEASLQSLVGIQAA